MNEHSNSTGFNWVLFVPSILVVFGLGIFIGVRGLPHAKELAAAQEALRSARATGITWNTVEGLKKQTQDLDTKLTATKALLVSNQREAEALFDHEYDQDRMASLNRTHRILGEHRLALTKEILYDNTNNVGLATSIKSATSALGTAIQASKAAPAAAGAPGFNPAALPQGVSPSDFVEEPRTSVANVNAKVTFREIEVHGTYADMLAATREISQLNSGISLVSIAFNRSVINRRKEAPHVWTLIVHIQPRSDDSAYDDDLIVSTTP